MKLSILHERIMLNLSEGRFGQAVAAMEPVLQSFGRQKRKHSINVGRRLHQVGVGKTGVLAGLAHDYFERGGSILELAQHVDELDLPEAILIIVHSLSEDENEIDDSIDNKPLYHIRQVLSGANLSQDMKDMIILVKVADRLDNLKKRLKKDDKIGKNYRRKSIELINYLVRNYAGKRRPMRELLDYIKDLLGKKTVPGI